MRPATTIRGRQLAPATALALLAACSAPAVAPDEAQPGETFAIVGVEVVPMDGDGILADHTVVVEDGRIVALEARAEITPPAEATLVDGGGRYLMPGLFDLHVHQERDEELLFYLANGVTTVLNLDGDPPKLELRAAIAAGERLGPRLLTCGETLRGSQIEPGTEAARIAAIAAAGYDCVKIYDDWTAEAYRAASDAAAEAGIAFMGHAPRNLPFTTVLDDGRQQIVHLEEIVYTTAELNDWLDRFRRGEPPRPEDAPEVALAEPVERIARQLVERGIWIVATQIVIDNYLARATDEGLAALAARPYLVYRDPVGRRRWARSAQHSARLRFEQQVALQHYMLGVFRERGVRMAAGTDASVASSLSVMPGWSLHEELAILESTGFSPYEALRSATVDAAAYLRQRRELVGAADGTVAVGARADLLLLDGNPLEDLDHARRPVAVIAGGRWIGRGELERRLAEVEAGFAPLEARLAALDPILESGAPAEWVSALVTMDSPPDELRSFVESEVNRRGYELLGDDRGDEAIEVFQLNVDTFPRSANTYDSLGEAWLEKGDRERAIALYRRALEVDPDFQNPLRVLRQLGVEP